MRLPYVDLLSFAQSTSVEWRLSGCGVGHSMTTVLLYCSLPTAITIVIFAARNDLESSCKEVDKEEDRRQLTLHAIAHYYYAEEMR